MDRLLSRLERRFGRFAIENLTLFIVGGMALVFVLAQISPEYVAALVLDLKRVRAGEVWRLFTYLFLPTTFQPLWFIFSLYMTYLIGTNLESEWGAFKYNVFYLMGMAGTTLAAYLTGGAQGNEYLNLSLFLAFATLFPEIEFRLYFILPVKVKWLGLLSAGFLVFSFVLGDWTTRGAIIAAVANYFLFFGGHLLQIVRGRHVRAVQAARRASLSSVPPPRETRACAICGASEDDGADIRVCTCEKCGGKPRNLCLPHARSH